MGAPDAEPRCALADPLPSRGLDRRLPGGACGTPRPRRTEPVAFSDRSAERGMAGRVRALATAGSLGTALRVPLGRWRLPAGSHGGACRVHAGDDRRDARGREGVGRLPSRRPGEHSSWRELLVEVKRRGLTIAPEIAVGDGALGFWKALEEIYPGTRHQRCWVHKTTNVLNKVPRAVQATMKADLREIHGAETRSAAEAAIDIFAEKYGAKYARAVECLRKDREALLTFYDFPAEHWDHLRTS